MPQLRQLPALAEPFQLRFEPVFRRRLAEHGHAEIADHIHAVRRIEAAFVQHDRRAAGPRPEQHVPERLRPAGAGRAPDEIVRFAIEPELRLHLLRIRVSVQVDDALGILRRAARIDDVGDIARSGRVAGEFRRAFDERVERDPTRRLAADEQVARARRRLLAHQIDFGAIAHVPDDRQRLAMVRAKREIFRTQLLRARHDDRAEPIERDHREEPRRESSATSTTTRSPFSIPRSRSAPAQRRVDRGDLGEAVLSSIPGGVDEEQGAPRLFR